MPINRNNAGASESVTPFANVDGSPMECAVYENQGGTPVLVHSPTTPATVVDDFEGYADTADFRSQWNTNDAPPDWGIGTSGPGLYEGSQYLEATDPGGGGDNVWTVPADGTLNYYPQRGDTITVHWTPVGQQSTKARTFFRFGVDTSSGGEGQYYFTEMEADTGNFELGMSGNPGMDTATPGYTLDTTYRIVIDFDTADDGTITADLYEPSDGYDTSVATVSITDTSITGRGIGVAGDWDGGTTAASHFDYITAGVPSGNDDGGATTDGGTVIYRDTYTHAPPSELGDRTWGAASWYDPTEFDDSATGWAFAGTDPQAVDADHTVTDQAELLTAMDTCADGDLIWIPGTATINLDGVNQQDVNAPNVTIASDRDENSRGGLLEITDPSAVANNDRWTFRITQPGFRMHGLRYHGSQTTFNDWVDYSTNMPITGTYIEADDAEVDGCVFRGFGHSGVAFRDDPSGSATSGGHVHHCDFVDNPQDALGYGVAVGESYPLVQYCYFDNNRHALAGSGAATCSYIIRESLFGEHGVYHQVDMHAPGGDKLFCYRNTFLFDADTVETPGNEQEAVKFRAPVGSAAEVYDNEFAHPSSRYTEVGPGTDGYAVFLEHDADPTMTFAEANISVFDNTLNG